MPRPAPLTLINIPRIERKPLSQMYDWAGLLGRARLPDEATKDLAHALTSAREGPALVAGLTLRRQADQLKRFGKALRRERPGRPEIKIRRLLADPRLGWDTEIFWRMEPLTNASTAVLAAEVEACRRHLLEMQEVDPQFRAMESAGGSAVWLFLVHAADSGRDGHDAWWGFVLAFLDSSGFPTDGLRQNPGRLKPLLDKLRGHLCGSPILKAAKDGKR